jgi:hypothetical protein
MNVIDKPTKVYSGDGGGGGGPSPCHCHGERTLMRVRDIEVRLDCPPRVLTRVVVDFKPLPCFVDTDLKGAVKAVWEGDPDWIVSEIILASNTAVVRVTPAQAEMPAAAAPVTKAFG